MTWESRKIYWEEFMGTGLKNHLLSNKKEFYHYWKEETLLPKLNQELEKLPPFQLELFKLLIHLLMLSKLLSLLQPEN